MTLISVKMIPSMVEPREERGMKKEMENMQSEKLKFSITFYHHLLTLHYIKCLVVPILQGRPFFFFICTISARGPLSVVK